jgi:hypothetical protein
MQKTKTIQSKEEMIARYVRQLVERECVCGGGGCFPGLCGILTNNSKNYLSYYYT